MQVADALHLLRSSDCSTAFVRGHREDRGVDGGYLKAGLGISLIDKTYTGIRVQVTVNQIPNGTDPALDFRLCAWDRETFALRAVTDNLAAQVNALPRDQNNIVPGGTGGSILAADFLEPLDLYEGERVILGTATHGEYPLRNFVLASKDPRKAASAIEPQLGFRVIPETEWTSTSLPVGGYQGGEPGPISAQPSGNHPIVDLF